MIRKLRVRKMEHGMEDRKILLREPRPKSTCATKGNAPTLGTTEDRELTANSNFSYKRWGHEGEKAHIRVLGRKKWGRGVGNYILFLAMCKAIC